MGSSLRNVIYTWKVEEGQTGTHLGSFGILETSSEEIHKKGNAVPAVALLLPAVQSAREAGRKSVCLRSAYIVTKDLQDWWKAFARKEGRRKDLRITGSAGFGRASFKFILRAAIPTRLLGSVGGGDGASDQIPYEGPLILNFEEIHQTY